MSRVGKKPITLTDKVKVTYNNREVTVQGEKGTLSRTVHPDVDLQIEDSVVNVTISKNDKKVRAFQGLTRSLLDNMVTGVTKGYERVLDINGIGYRAEVKGNTIVLNVGYSNPVNFNIPDGVSATVDKKNSIKLEGIDKEKLGSTAASIRRIRPPEPYKGKGIKYAEEHIRRKAGKTGTK